MVDDELTNTLFYKNSPYLSRYADFNVFRHILAMAMM